MLPSPADAERRILELLRPLPTEDCPLAEAHGRVLRRPIMADRPQPPFDRVTMDGFALRAESAAAAGRRFEVLGLQAAGMMARPLPTARADACIEIATGAVLPPGADCVVAYEETQRDGSHVTLATDAVVAAGRHVHRTGSDFARGAEIVPTGTRLSGRSIAVAAACGYAHVTVSVRPRVAVVATGDELVEVATAEVAPHQIRKSNDYALRASLLASGWVACADRHHLRDFRPEIESTLRRLLPAYDVILLTGGVSKGRFDHLPAALADLGVESILRGVAQRPGKPLWFGLSPRRTPVFALPGNPVSALTCLHRYVLPALARLADAPLPPPRPVALTQPVRFPAPLAYLLPVALAPDPADPRHLATPAPFNTSGDFGGLVGTDGFVELPAEQTDFPAGTVAPFRAWV